MQVHVPVLQHLFVNTILKYMYSLSKKYLNCTQKRKPFWQLCRFSDFAVGQNANLFLHQKLKNLFSRAILYTLWKESFARKKIDNLRNEFLEIFVKTSRNKVSLLPMKKLHKNSPNKEIIRQKFFLPVFLKLNQTFRLINKGTSCLLYKSN